MRGTASTSFTFLTADVNGRACESYIKLQAWVGERVIAMFDGRRGWARTSIIFLMAGVGGRTRNYFLTAGVGGRARQ